MQNPLLYIAMLGSMCLSSWVALRVFPSLRALAVQTSGKYRSLDGVRGLLASSVFVSHAHVAHRFFATDVWTHPTISYYRFAGTGSVAIFFMITGLLFWDKAIDGKVHAVSLLVSRVRRIMPLYLLSCVLIFLICGLKTEFSLAVPPGELLASIGIWLAGGALGTPPINGVGTLLINCGVTWTLQYEWAFYLLLPLAARYASPKGFAGLSLLFFVALSAMKWAGYANVANPMVVALPFLGGMLAAHLVRRLPSHLATHPLASAFVAASFLLGSLFYKEGATTIVAGLLVPAFVLLALGNDLFGLLRLRAIRWLGHISFSVYLLHGIFLMAQLHSINASIPLRELSPSAYILICAAISALVVFLCSGTYVFVERHFMTGPGMRLPAAAERY